MKFVYRWKLTYIPKYGIRPETFFFTETDTSLYLRLLCLDQYKIPYNLERIEQ